MGLWQRFFGSPKNTTPSEQTHIPPAPASQAVQQQAALLLLDLAECEAIGDRTTVKARLLAMLVEYDAEFRCAVYAAIKSESPEDLDLILQILQDMRPQQ